LTALAPTVSVKHPEYVHVPLEFVGTGVPALAVEEGGVRAPVYLKVVIRLLPPQSWKGEPEQLKSHSDEGEAVVAEPAEKADAHRHSRPYSILSYQL
jgi:hypothetical protein